MKNSPHIAHIYATSEQEAKEILTRLLDERLVSGGFIAEGTSMYWWKKRIDEERYCMISAFTMDKHKERIIRVVRELSRDDVPGIVFLKIDDANKDFLGWIDEYTKKE